MKKTWKRNLIAAGVLLVVCAGIYLNWYAGHSAADLTETLDAGKILDDTTLVLQQEQGDALVTPVQQTGTQAEYFAQMRLSRQTARDEAVELLQETIAYADGDAASSAKLEGIISDALAESQIESLIVAKGYQDCVAYISEDGISVAVAAPEDFNAIGSCIQKEYVYQIYNSRIRDAFLEHRVCFYPQPLDFARLARAGRAFEGTHDFAAVRSVGTETRTTVRTVHWCRAERDGPLISIAVCADGFLYNMVRAIVGTMVYASYGKIEPEAIPALLATRDRRLTGPTMPPQGLYLNRVWYDGAVGDMMNQA